MKWLDSVGGRKFALVLLVTLLCTVLVWFGKIDGNAFQLIMLGIVGVYVAGNVIQKRAEPKQ